RAVAILLVYALTGAVLYVSAAAIFPRVYSEGVKLMRDAPALGRELSAEWSPRIERWVDGIFNRVSPEASKGIEASEPEAPALEIIHKPEGGLRIEVGTGLDVVQHGPGHWRIGPVAPRSSSRIDVAELTDQGIEEFLGYVKRNALDLIRIGHAVVSQVARGVFLLFMTLMVAGYLMHTRE